MPVGLLQHDSQEKIDHIAHVAVKPLTPSRAPASERWDLRRGVPVILLVALWRLECSDLCHKCHRILPTIPCMHLRQGCASGRGRRAILLVALLQHAFLGQSYGASASGSSDTCRVGQSMTTLSLIDASLQSPGYRKCCRGCVWAMRGYLSIAAPV